MAAWKYGGCAGRTRGGGTLGTIQLGEYWLTQQEGRGKENRERKILGESLRCAAGRIQLREEDQPAIRFLLSERNQGVPLGRPDKSLHFVPWRGNGTGLGKGTKRTKPPE